MKHKDFVELGEHLEHLLSIAGFSYQMVLVAETDEGIGTISVCQLEGGCCEDALVALSLHVRAILRTALETAPEGERERLARRFCTEEGENVFQDEAQAVWQDLSRRQEGEK